MDSKGKTHQLSMYLAVFMDGKGKTHQLSMYLAVFMDGRAVKGSGRWSSALGEIPG